MICRVAQTGDPYGAASWRLRLLARQGSAEPLPPQPHPWAPGRRGVRVTRSISRGGPKCRSAPGFIGKSCGLAVVVAGRRPYAPCRCSHHRRHQPRPEERSGGRTLSRRSLLPSERLSHPDRSFAASQGRYSVASTAFCAAVGQGIALPRTPADPRRGVSTTGL